MKIYTVLTCEARNRQRLINKFLEKNIPLKKIALKGDEMRLRVEDRHLKQALEILRASGSEYSIESRGGAYIVRQTVLRYLSLALAAIAAIAFLIIMSGVCFSVDVKVDDPLVKSQIYGILEDAGVKKYSLKRNIDTRQLSLKISGDIEEVGFANCYFDGGALKIEIKKVHKVEESENYTKIVADRDCIVTRVLVYSGTAVVKEGDIVKAGDTLIEGYIDTAPDSEDNERLAVPARGEVYAQTSYSKNITLGSRAVEAEDTGNSRTFTDLYVFGKLIGKSKLPKYSQYRVVEERKTFGSLIPITAVTRTYYETRNVEIELSEAQIDGQISLACIELWQDIPEGAKVVDNYNFKKKVDNLYIIDIYYILEETVSKGE